VLELTNPSPMPAPIAPPPSMNPAPINPPRIASECVVKALVGAAAANTCVVNALNCATLSTYHYSSSSRAHRAELFSRYP
jgi:hypothetical protein